MCPSMTFARRWAVKTMLLPYFLAVIGAIMSACLPLGIRSGQRRLRQQNWHNENSVPRWWCDRPWAPQTGLVCRWFVLPAHSWLVNNPLERQLRSSFNRRISSKTSNSATKCRPLAPFSAKKISLCHHFWSVSFVFQDTWNPWERYYHPGPRNSSRETPLRF